MIYTYSVNKIIKPSELKEIIENSLLITPIYVTFNAENNTLIIKFNSTLNASEITMLNNLIDDYVTIIDEVILSGHSQLILDDGTNPHETTKSDVALGNVDNVQQYPNSNPLGFETPTQLSTRDTNNRNRSNHTGTQLTSTISDFDTEVENNTQVSQNTTHRELTDNPHNVTATQIALGNVDNTSDLTKPISTATQSALNNKQNLLNTSSLSIAGSLSTTSTNYTLMTNMQQVGLDFGDYLFSFGGWMEQSQSHAEIFTQIYVNGTPVSGSEMKFKIGRVGGGNRAEISTSHNYCNFPLNNIPNNTTVEVRWKVNTGTGTINNRYFTIFKT